MQITVVILLACFSSSLCMIDHIPLPRGMLDCFDRYAEKTNVVDTVGESIASFCYGQYMWTASRELGLPGFNISREAYTWVQSLLRKPDAQRHKRQVAPPNRRIRKEYRRLTDLERANFHRAIQLLKADTSVMPTMYDALSAIHQGMVTTAAHGGPNFLGWHRVYILMFENALRSKVPSVTIPYWDSTLDEPLMNPTQSIIFTDTFLGNGFGMVNTGPFAGWTTLSGPLIRNIGQAGQLFNTADMARIVSSVRMAQITEPNAHVNSSLEFLHNQVHLWIDGQMGSLETAAHDPIFWLHHSYVDYIWELFRKNQRRFGIDPTTDYPTFVNNSMHTAMYPMGLANLRNIDGMNDRFTSMIYQYEPAPTCSLRFPDCGSPYLRCVMIGFQPRCVSVDWTGAPRVAAGRQRFFNRAVQGQRMQAMARMNMLNAARRQHARMTIQNRIRISRRQRILLADIRQQQAIIKEVENSGLDDPSELSAQMQRRSLHRRHRRSPMGNSFSNRPANTPSSHGGNSFVRSKLNINPNIQMPILPSIIPQLPSIVQNSSTTFVPPLMLNMCPAMQMSQGYQNTFNLNGRSDINQWVYIPVKVIFQRPPTYSRYTSYPIVNGEVEAEDIYSPNAFAAVQSAIPVGKPASYTHCKAHENGAGKVYISSQGMNYMGTYKEYAVVDHRLAISIATAYVAVKSPEFGASQVFLNAYDSCGRICQPFCKIAGTTGFQRCSGAFMVTSDFPKLYGTNYGDAVTHLWKFSKTDRCPIMQDQNIYIQFHCNFKESWPFGVQPPAAGLGPNVAALDEFEEPETKSAMAQGHGSSAPIACHIGHGCILANGCNKCMHGTTHQCIGACSLYTNCQNGEHQLRTCPDNTKFDVDDGDCVPGTCLNNQNSWWFH